jgi:hypothetical protein
MGSNWALRALTDGKELLKLGKPTGVFFRMIRCAVEQRLRNPQVFRKVTNAKAIEPAKGAQVFCID